MAPPCGAAPGTPLSASAAQQPTLSFQSADSTTSHPLSATNHEGKAPIPDLGTPVTIHLAAQRGDLATIIQLLKSGQATVNDRDPDGITPLHWASINAQLPICRYLLDNGADVDALGGDLVASPLQWAARNGHIYVLELLIERGADPTITDSQGFNALHLTTHSSAVVSLVFMLQHPTLSTAEGIDSTDSQGHTALMWAAYQGDAISVDILLKHGADVYKKDGAGLTPMHWAVVKGNRLCIRLLAEAKSDLWAKEASGKTPRDMAQELKSIAAYGKALADVGLEEDGRKKSRTFGGKAKAVVMLVPFTALGLIFATFSTLPWYTAVPLAMAEFFGMHHVITRVVLDPLEHDSMQKSNYFLAIVSGSIAWVGWEWASKIASSTPGYATVNLAFALTFMLCAWNLFRAATLEPGYSVLPQTPEQRSSCVHELASQGRLKDQTFCVSCMAKKPLRSKHCKLCKRCVARHDHHCPWVSNCVGINNHRQFIVFIVTLVAGICMFIYLTFAYFITNAPPYDPLPDSSFESCTFFCTVTNFDPFLLGVCIWAALQLTWTIVLLIAQVWQICRQMTTLEVSNLGRYGFMGGKSDQSYSGQQNYIAIHSRSASESLDAIQEDECPHKHRGRKAGGCSNVILGIVGLDLYTRGKAGEGLTKASKAANPFDMGLIANCQDFWSRGRLLNVDYTQLYDVPPQGFGSIAALEQVQTQDENRRWSMWKNIRPRSRGDYALVPGHVA